MKHYLEIVFVSGILLTSFLMQGCNATKTDESSIADSGKMVMSDSYANSYCNKSSKDFFCFKSMQYSTDVLNYDTMKIVSLCSKPNCKHNGTDCIEKRLDGNVPVFDGKCAYYFVDDEPQIMQNEDEKYDLKLGSNLYCYDFGSNTEKRLIHVDASVSDNCYGWLLHDNVLFFIENQYRRSYNEDGNIITSGNTGGKMSLHSVRLSDLQINDLGELYNLERITEFYPLAANSGEVYMKGLYDNKIYFNVGFVDEADSPNKPEYRVYSTYYDLTDGTYHGTPEDYEHIDFASVNYASEDYLLICRQGEATVYKKGEQQPVVLNDPYFHQETTLSVMDNTVFCGDKAFDLTTKNVKILDGMLDKSVIARYDNFYIISEWAMQSDFEKIPAEKLLN